MSVIHEAVKRARAAWQEKRSQTPAPARAALTVRPAPARGAWLAWLMLFFVLAEGALYWRERALRLRSQEKMRAAYLELNDARGEVLQKKQVQIRNASELRELRTKLDEALRSKTEVLNAKQAVEYDNLDKQKKVSDLTKRAHKAEMDKFQLQYEINALKAELAKISPAAAPEPASK
jgi:hypothetical protein